ncbi:DUF4178 domain-containing protein [Pedobacter africanus]|uniref:DUF4178 domain-containing protein n=1 Tax=Pedobacter africanus TaxID=151894 RepID=A0A1W2EAW2_9SPHI|nr:DUF4178 domain-containing protein [Pedobacter africanus]SMD06805.1 protein of unknown function [Pedobacter africanus]
MATTALTSFPEKELAECPECQAGITLYDPAGSEFCTCTSCKSYIQFVNEQPKKIKATKGPLLPPVIPLGTLGALKDIPFKVIAYIERDEDNVNYAWREYVLYNYEKGYAMLSEYDGHWNLIFGKNFLPGLEKPLDGNDYIMYQDVEYKLFHKYAPRTTFVTGEFDWDVLKEQMNVREYIAPPYILIKEQARFDKEKDYYQGEYLEPKVIAAAFGLDVNLFPSKTGVLANQPSKAYHDWKWSLMVGLYLILGVMVIQFFIAFLKPEQVIFDENLELTYTPDKGLNEFKPVMSPSFELRDAASALDMTISSDVSNSWLEATVVLVNEATNQTWEVTKGVEYYEGIEDGERWSEGEKSAEIVVSGIPRGKYHMNIYPAAGSPASNMMSIKVTTNTILWRNIFVALAVLCLIPVVNLIRMSMFERKRWENSEYSPYHS